MQLGELGLEMQGGHRLISFQVETQVLNGADATADAIAGFAQVLFAAVDGRPAPATSGTPPRRAAIGPGRSATGKGARAASTGGTAPAATARAKAPPAKAPTGDGVCRQDGRSEGRGGHQATGRRVDVAPVRLEGDMTAIACVIFDLDGVLVDSEIWWDEVRAAFAAEHGRTWDPADQAAVMGANSAAWARIMRERMRPGPARGGDRARHRGRRRRALSDARARPGSMVPSRRSGGSLPTVRSPWPPRRIAR